jgi:hypothetical protein
MLTNGLQSCVEGITGLDPDIGGAELHQLCYDALQPAWCDWLGNYHLPLRRQCYEAAQYLLQLLAMLINSQ